MFRCWLGNGKRCFNKHQRKIILLLIGAFIYGVSADICSSNISEDDAKKAIHRGNKPKNGSNAGRYTKDINAVSVLDCVVSCCNEATCDSVFFHQNTCYQLECNRSIPGACDPFEANDPKFNNTYYINVRTVEYTSSSSSSSSTTSPPLTQPTTCEFGILGECKHEHEVCVLREGSKSRMGLCKCEQDYHRDENSNCVKADLVLETKDKKTSEDHTDSSTGTTKAPTSGEVKPGDDGKKVIQLTVSAGDNKIITLPENTVTLSAFVLPKPLKDEDPYHYDWSLVTFPEGAETGTMEGKNTDTLKLSKLIAGLYTLKITVTGENKYGEAVVTVTVQPPARTNTHPVAIIKPKTQVVKTTNSAILDGSDSTDDDRIVSYHWDEVIGPLQDQSGQGEEAMITLKNMAPGNYTFKLTVTDSDGVTNSTTANVTFIKETDYPPKANAGSDVVIHLPQSSVTLYGNASTDDRGITSYEWIKKADDKLAVDMTVRVCARGRMETNNAPVARTLKKVTVSLPRENLILDGSNSTDDQKIATYAWKQKGGPTLTIQNSDRAVAMGTGKIEVGEYTFTLTVTDEDGASSSADLTVTVHENSNQAPVANAGGDKVVYLPLATVTLDGSRSHDDVGIKSYDWVRDEKSLAAGDVVNGSNHQAVLQLSNVVAGRYIFKLSVVDAAGLSSSDTASVIVKEDPHKGDLIEMLLDVDIQHFTQENKNNLVNQLQLLLHKSSQVGDTIISIQHLGQDYTSGHLHITFLVKSKLGNKEEVRSGPQMLRVLKRKLVSESSVIDYRVISLDTVVCQNNCSGHGHCDLHTKKCICEAFWMQNFFKLYVFEKESNCDWSILYVVIVCFVIVVSIAGGTWGIICCLRSKRTYRCRWKSRKRHRYSLLREVDDEEDKNKLELMPKGKIQNSSVMISESDFSSEEETLFVNSKKPNGHIQKPLNGISKQHYKAKLKA
ncbi:dyslexia-associated protein KIAA0319-like protein [Haliotis rubra]|uniref:dyslexia-associated protein KIAA0319-like protein n=1 Tax=Haliotis rubra TaxID=36100 RepID=UPI001EE617A4|nr:dyslexia-associated protein KIAA0319-like protein [Haliotis rubra]